MAELRNGSSAAGVGAPVKPGVRRFTILGLALVSALGCSGADVARPQTATTTNALDDVLSSVNSRCPGFEAAKAEPGDRDKLFVETAILDVPSAWAAQASLQNLADLPRKTEVHLLASPHLMGKFDQRSEMVLGEVVLGPEPRVNEQASLVRWSVIPHRADRAAVLDVELELAPPTSDGVTAPTPRVLRFSMTGQENEPALARVVWDEASRRSLLLLFRTFEIRGEDDLRAIFQCKMQQHAQAVSRARAEPR